MNIFLSISPNICFWCSNELASLDGSLEKPQLMISLEIRKISCNIAFLSRGLLNVSLHSLS